MPGDSAAPRAGATTAVTGNERAAVSHVTDVTLSFGGLKVLDAVSFDVFDDELVAVIGPNGAGKTSLINCLGGFYRPQQGSIAFLEKNVRKMRPHEIARLGMARTFQGAHLFSGMTVLDNIMTGRHCHMKSNILQAFLYFPWVHREEVAEREFVEEIIDLLEIENIRHEIVGDLGYGLRKRVDLGRALAMEPKMLMMDEPMAGMNSEEKEDLARFILDVREVLGIPVVLVEHDMSVVMDLADRVVVLDFGRKLAEGTPSDIRRHPDVIKAYLGQGA